MANSNYEHVDDGSISNNSNYEDNAKLLPISVRVSGRRMKLTTNISLISKKKVLWKLVLLFMGLFFFAAAYVQHNDPDPYLWMPVYLLPCLMNLIFLFHLPTMNSPKFWNIFNLTVVIHICYCFILGLFILAVYYLHDLMATYFPLFPSPNSISEPNMSLEEGKELLGLCLVIAWLAFLYNGNFLKSGKGGIALAVMLTGLPILAWVYLEKVEEENNANNCRIE